MKTKTSSYSNVLWVLAALLWCGQVTECVRAQAAKQDGAASSSTKVKFRPAASGAASVRVTGGSRGSGNSQVTLDVLAPDEVGVTTQEQPSLYWFQSKPAQAKFELTLLEETNLSPLFRSSSNVQTKPGSSV